MTTRVRLARGAVTLGALLLALTAAAAGPPARLATPEALARELGALHGKVVLLNVWATWCVPCLKEVPDLVTVQAELAGRDFVLLGLSIDEPADLSRVESFRQKYFADFHTLVRGTTDMDAAVSVVDPAWNEIVPTTYVIARDGRVIERIQGKKTLAEFRKAAVAALAQ